MSIKLVTYFSASGTTRTVAEHLAKAINADIVELIPALPYTASDLNWTDHASRCVREHENPSIRPEIADMPDISAYDTVFVGYPLWWEQAPNIIRTFLEGQDFSGKTVVTFATSSTSTRGADGAHLHGCCSTETNWKTGKRLTTRDGEAALSQWVKELGL
ncbi:flavodoxin [Bifidobacterium pullorum]|uniref:flavodoxin n=1 Tax=Bifidobacterium pullorum TaxID=78448 RepID=UPI00052A06E7|nr:flavodoxin [Bifidobacterium pullorum]